MTKCQKNDEMSKCQNNDIFENDEMTENDVIIFLRLCQLRCRRKSRQREASSSENCKGPEHEVTGLSNAFSFPCLIIHDEKS